jgi:alpha-glucosidase
VPLPWGGNRPPFGFTADGVAPWLPQPEAWSALTVAAQRTDPASMLSLYRAALHLRRELPDLHTAPLTWRPSDDEVLAFDRGSGFACVVNLSARPVALEGRVLLASGPCSGDLPPDTAAWLSSPGTG